MEKDSLENLKTESVKDSKGPFFTDAKPQHKKEGSKNDEMTDSFDERAQI